MTLESDVKFSAFDLTREYRQTAFAERLGAGQSHFNRKTKFKLIFEALKQYTWGHIARLLNSIFYNFYRVFEH